MLLRCHAIHVPTALPSLESLEQHFGILDHDTTALREIQGFRLLDDKKRALISRLLPRYALLCLGLEEWRRIEFRKTKLGRPFAIHSELPEQFRYSIAHDHDWVVCASTVGQRSFGIKNVGIDLMKICVPWDDSGLLDLIEIIKEQLSAKELDSVQASTFEPTLQLELLLSYWCLKEAYIKALSLGLSGFSELNRLEFTLQKNRFAAAPADGLSRSTATLDGEQLEGWWFDLKKLDEDYLLAVAVEREEQGDNEARVPQVELKVVDFASMVDTLRETVE